MDEDKKLYWILGIAFAVYLIAAYFFPVISWIIIIAAFFCWLGG